MITDTYTLSKAYLNPFLPRFFAITSLIETVLFDNSITLETINLCFQNKLDVSY